MASLKLKICKAVINATKSLQVFPSPLFVVWGSTSYKIKGPEQRRILTVLKRGDIVLRRYDRYVTGWFIPGYYTHVALVVSKSRIIHATTHGVGFEDALTFFRADQVCILRPECSDKVKQRAVKRAREMQGKDYDFAYETGDDDRFYCSELIKYAFDGALGDLGEGVIEPDEFLKAKVEKVHESKVWREQQKKVAATDAGSSDS